MQDPEVVHFVVLYRAARDLPALLEYWAGRPEVASGQVRVILLENGGSVKEDLRLPQGVELWAPGDNLGYIGAPRWALPRVLPWPWRWLIISNSDLSFAPDFYRGLLSKHTKNCGMLAPQIRGSLSGGDQNPNMSRRPSRVKMWFWTQIKSNYLTAILHHALGLARGILQKHSWVSQRFSSAQAGDSIYAPHGSVLLFSRRFFDAGGDLNFPTFLFGEELYFAERARELQLPILYSPDLKVIHREHGTTGLWPKPLLIRYAYNSMKAIYQDYFAASAQRR